MFATKCTNDKCFACLRGNCYALSEPEYDKTGECSFFKPVGAVDRETMRRICPRPEKTKIDYSETAKMPSKDFEKWFASEWNAITLYLLANHREKISRIPVTMELS